MLKWSTLDFIVAIHSCMLGLTVKIFAGKINLKLLQTTRVHIAKIKPDPIWRKINKANKENWKVRAIIYKALGEVHKGLTESKNAEIKTLIKLLQTGRSYIIIKIIV